jgi:hypothetical protein
MKDFFTKKATPDGTSGMILYEFAPALQVPVPPNYWLQLVVPKCTHGEKNVT